MFAINPETPLDDKSIEILRDIAKFVVKKRLETPALMFLETFRPMNFIGSQLMAFFEPFIGSFLKSKKYEDLIEILNDRRSISSLIDLIEDEMKKRKTYVREET